MQCDEATTVSNEPVWFVELERAVRANKMEKFYPIRWCQMRKANPTPVVTGAAPRKGFFCILIIKRIWLELILEGKKTLEIRGQNSSKRFRIYLALSGGGGVLLGSVEMFGVVGPLTFAEYDARRQEHCVAGCTLPYKRTFGYELRNPQRFAQPVPYTHTPHVIVWDADAP
jgi:hypothetical protein